MKQGDKLYKYQGFSKYAEYIVTAVIKRESLTQYELECQNCEHGFKCRILVKKIRGTQQYEFLCCVNDEEEEYKAWHTDWGKKEELYYHSLKEARIAVYESAISRKKSEIKNHQDIIVNLEKNLLEIQSHFENIKNAEA